jgi:hypothetical protein
MRYMVDCVGKKNKKNKKNKAISVTRRGGP